jgi:hypothetical protein
MCCGSPSGNCFGEAATLAQEPFGGLAQFLVSCSDAALMWTGFALPRVALLAAALFSGALGGVAGGLAGRWPGAQRAHEQRECGQAATRTTSLVLFHFFLD